MYPKLDEKKVLFVTVPCMFRAYTGTRINAATQVYPIQAYLWLSAWVKTLGFKTRVFDMGVRDPQKARCWYEFIEFLIQEKPKFVCMTVTTPLFYEAKLVGIIAKQILGPEVKVIHGGIHATVLPRESLEESMCDIVVIGEGEKTFGEICQGKPYNEIKGIAYRIDNGRKMTITVEQILSRLEKDELAYYIQLNAVESHDADIRKTMPRRNMTGAELDDLPHQDLELYDIWRYWNPRVITRNNPLIQYETSRGCPFTCNFCSAEDQYRVISPDRVIEELKYYRDFGIKELRISDDQFLTHPKRGEIIAEKMLEAGLHFDINLGNGVRADRCTRKFLELFKRAGLYQAGAGFESGDQESLDSIQKSLSIDKSLEVMNLFREVGIEVVGFFMIGTPADTFKSMQRTIDFAQALMPDYAKVTICIPFPDTRLYADYDRRGLIHKPERWDLYNIHKAAGVYTHPNPELTPEVLTEWYKKFYKAFYRNPKYLAWQFKKSMKEGSIWWKGMTAARTFFPRIFKTSPLDNIEASYKK